MIEDCPLCDHSPVKVQSVSGRDTVEVNCLRCGTFLIPGGMPLFRSEIRPLLSIYTRTRSDDGEISELSSQAAEEVAKQIAAVTIENKRSRIVSHMKNCSSFMGDWVPIDLQINWPLFCTRSDKELQFLLEDLKANGIIESKSSVFDDPPAYRLTVKGWHDSEIQGDKDNLPFDQDAVTGVGSRKQWETDLPKFLDDARNELVPMSLLVVDLDKLKTLNDQLGHDGADNVLKSVGRELSAVIKGKGTVYRYGGDEFGILLPNFSTQEAESVAERVRRKIEDLSDKKKGVSVTVTIGVATCPVPVTDPTDLFRIADRLLLDSKKQDKRNRVLLTGERTGSSKTNAVPDAKAWKMILTLSPLKKQTIPDHQLADWLVKCSYPIGSSAQFVTVPLDSAKSNIIKDEGWVYAKREDNGWEWNSRCGISSTGAATLILEQKYHKDVKALSGNVLISEFLMFSVFAQRLGCYYRIQDYKMTLDLGGIHGALLSLDIGLLFTYNWSAAKSDYKTEVPLIWIKSGSDGLTNLILEVLHAVATPFAPNGALSLGDFKKEWVRGQVIKFIDTLPTYNASLW